LYAVTGVQTCALPIFPFSTEKVNVVSGGSGFTNLMAWGRTHWTL